MLYDQIEPIGQDRLLWMMAQLCSIVANTSQDSEGKSFVYRRGQGGGRGLPDPTMMRPEDFLLTYGADGAEPPARDRAPLTSKRADEMIAALFPGAVDLRPKDRRDAPRRPSP